MEIEGEIKGTVILRPKEIIKIGVISITYEPIYTPQTLDEKTLPSIRVEIIVSEEINPSKRKEKSE